MGLFTQQDGAKTLVWDAGSRTILAFVDAAKRRRRGIVIGAVVLLVLAGIGAFGAMRYLRAQAAERVIEGWSSLSGCLLGQPLEKGQTASLRFRAMQLTAVTNFEVKRQPAAGEPWPDRCGRHALQLNEGLKGTALGEGDGKELVASSEKLGELLAKKEYFWQDMSEAVDQTFEHATKSGIVLRGKPDIPKPPAAASALTADGLATGTSVSDRPVDLGKVNFELHGSSQIRFLVGDPAFERAPFLCSFGRDAARCTSLSKRIVAASPTDHRLLGTADENAPPLLFSGKAGADGVFRSDSGDLVEKASSIGGYVASDGFASVLALDKTGKRLELFRSTAGGEKTKRRLVIPTPFKVEQPRRDAQLLYGHLMVIGEKADELWLAGAQVDPGIRGLTRFEEIGKLRESDKGEGKEKPRLKPKAEPKLRLTGCKSSQAVVVRAVSEGKSVLSFRLNNRWSKPVQVPSATGTLSCQRSEAAITLVDTGRGSSPLASTITQHLCTPAECKSQTLTLRELLLGELGLAPAAVVAAIGLDGKLLVAWQAGQRGGLRFRLAPVGQIAQAPDVIIYDDLVLKGAVQQQSTLLDLRLLATESFALLLLNTTTGLHGIRVKPDGSYEPV
ncbi:MAG: hypothetical protein DRI90_26235 [Deltaproteobacteria bacterium]|nr:MAG: hypothetical protein DRI90_26235 [Deltaproteobacteria bacterium]